MGHERRRARPSQGRARGARWSTPRPRLILVAPGRAPRFLVGDESRSSASSATCTTSFIIGGRGTDAESGSPRGARAERWPGTLRSALAARWSVVAGLRRAANACDAVHLSRSCAPAALRCTPPHRVAQIFDDRSSLNPDRRLCSPSLPAHVSLAACRFPPLLAYILLAARRRSPTRLPLLICSPSAPPPVPRATCAVGEFRASLDSMLCVS